MLRALFRVLCYVPTDVRSKRIIERAAKARGLSPAHLSTAEADEIAASSGLQTPSCQSTAELISQKEQIMGMLEAQKRKRIARREAFLEWQAGQREKGAAHRLLRQSRRAEKYKRHHYHAVRGRFVSTATVQQGSEPAEGLPPAHNNRLPAENCRVPIALGRKL